MKFKILLLLHIDKKLQQSIVTKKFNHFCEFLLLTARQEMQYNISNRNSKKALSAKLKDEAWTNTYVAVFLCFRCQIITTRISVKEVFYNEKKFSFKNLIYSKCQKIGENQFGILFIYDTTDENKKITRRSVQNKRNRKNKKTHRASSKNT